MAWMIAILTFIIMIGPAYGLEPLRHQFATTKTAIICYASSEIDPILAELKHGGKITDISQTPFGTTVVIKDRHGNTVAFDELPCQPSKKKGAKKKGERRSP